MEDNLRNNSVGVMMQDAYFLKNLIDKIENIDRDEQINRALKYNIPFTDGFFISLLGFDSEERSRICTYLVSQLPHLKEIKSDFLKIEKQNYVLNDIDSDEIIELFFECYDFIEVLNDMEEYKKTDEYKSDQTEYTKSEQFHFDPEHELEGIEINSNLCLLNSQQIGYMFNLFQDTIIKKDSISFYKYAHGMQMITGRSAAQLQKKRNNKLSKKDYEKMNDIFKEYISQLEKEIQKF